MLALGHVDGDELERHLLLDENGGDPAGAGGHCGAKEFEDHCGAGGWERKREGVSACLVLFIAFL